MYDNITVNLFISGRVQGVFFRYNIYKKAVSLSLKGFVKNLSDGRVEVMAQGKKEDVGKLVEFCKRGPLLAKVKKVEINYEREERKFKEFKIIR